MPQVFVVDFVFCNFIEFISSDNFCGIFRVFCVKDDVVYRDSLPLPFQSGCLLILVPLYCLAVFLRTTSAGSFLPGSWYWRERVQFLTTECSVSWGLFTCGLVKLIKFLLLPLPWASVSWKVWHFAKLFCHISWFSQVSCPPAPGSHPTWPQAWSFGAAGVDPLLFCWVFFICIHPRYWPVVFHFCLIFSFLPSSVFWKTEKDWRSFLQCLVEVAGDAPGPTLFFVGSGSITASSS